MITASMEIPFPVYTTILSPMQQKSEAIIREVAMTYGVPPKLLISNHRGEDAVRARHIVMWRLRNQLGFSYPKIGRILSRDHTTVMHGVKKVQGKMDSIRAKLEADHVQS